MKTAVCKYNELYSFDKSLYKGSNNMPETK